ncbi:Ff.00g039620.m01.CDS01 [Fusarium sp. VM40]|nr:Ff.00g039620.m01.CDS01 [Fusarium sp. VM40]
MDDHSASNPPVDNPHVDTPHVEYEYIIRTEEYLPIELIRHLLRVQGQINRLAAEQDLQVMDLEGEVDRLRGDVSSLQREMNSREASGDHNGIVLAWIVAGMGVLLTGFWVAGFPYGN